MTTETTENDIRELDRERQRARETARLRRRAEIRSIRLSVLLHLNLVAAARRRGISVNALVIEAIREKLSEA